VVVETLYRGTQRVVLANGLRILIEEVPQSRSASVGVWINAGSRDDPAESPGLAHFLEHLIFKGTTTRTGLRLSQEIDAVGGFLDAATGKEATFFFADVPAEGVTTAIDLLLDMVFHPLLAPEQIELERTVVLEEIRGYDDDPEQRAFDQFVADLWQSGHPLSRTVLGTRDAIQSVTRSEFEAFLLRFYRPENMVIAAAGAIDSDRLIRTIEATTPERNAGGQARSSRIPPIFRPGRSHHVQPTGQTHVYLACPGPLSDDPDRYALEVANAVLGDGTSSRLFRSIREDRGLAYAVQSTISRYSDAGVWLAYAAVAPNTAETVTGLLLTELDRLRSEPIPPEEVALAKSRLRGSFILGLESNANRAMRLGTAAIAERAILSPDEILEIVDSIEPNAVHEAVLRHNRPDRINIATIGPSA
jgi:predicted Zn-dependent peptidase